MMNRRLRRVVGLHQGEGRARHLLLRPGQGTDEGAGEDRLAGTQIAEQREHIAGPRAHGQPPGQGFGRGFVGQVQGQVIDFRHLVAIVA